MSDEYISLIDGATKYARVSLAMYKLKQSKAVDRLPISRESKRILKEAIY